jgi:hypothetical protein
MNRVNKFSIVAAHGLNSHPDQCWSAKITKKSDGAEVTNKSVWITDFLSRDFPQARVMTYGYNSDIRGSNKSSLRDIAEELLQELISERKDCRRRPLIFICHSLGGILVKQVCQVHYKAQQNSDSKYLGPSYSAY